MTPDELFHDLYRLQVAYWYEVDNNGGRAAAGFFTGDGMFIVGTERMTGRAEIDAFYEWRRRRGERTARHLVSNCFVAEATDASAEFRCIMSLYADDGAPVLPAKAPVMIADVVDACVREDGVWRFRSHALRTVFQGGVQPTIPTRSELIAHRA